MHALDAHLGVSLYHSGAQTFTDLAMNLFRARPVETTTSAAAEPRQKVVEKKTFSSRKRPGYTTGISVGLAS